MQQYKVNSMQYNPYNTAVGFHDVGEISNMTLGDLKAIGLDLITKTKGNTALGLPPDKGSSAMGKYQMINPTRERLARAEFGDNWQNVKYSPEVQEALARRLYNETKGDYNKLVGQWDGLKHSQLLKDNPNLAWEEASKEIARFESSSGGKPSTYVASNDRQYVTLDTEEGLAKKGSDWVKPDYSEERDRLLEERAAQLAERDQYTPISTKDEYEYEEYIQPYRFEGLAAFNLPTLKNINTENFSVNSRSGRGSRFLLATR